MQKRVLVILASARENSNTMKALERLCPFEKYETVDLRTITVGYYRYDASYPKNDDFLSIVTRMQEADVIVFATPVYWYAMSGLMKVFFDRFTDLLTIHKSVGRQLKGKEVYLIAQGSEASLPEGFEIPFRRTSDYFKMEFRKSFYMQFS
jgi:multimeric flavodoxin WrbA